jgi:prepilin-type N-terminal cleavage/methylation domain-containing protein
LISRLRREAGYSLIEMVVVLSIMGVVMTGLTSAFVAGSKGENDMNRRFQAQQDTRVALDRIRGDIHCATSATLTTVGGAPTTYKATLTAPSGASCATVSWCTVSVGGSSTRFALYRQAGATCGSAGGLKIADYLTQANAFPTYTAQSTSSLASLSVDFEVSVKGSQQVANYRLADTIFLRNSTRT